MKRPLHMRPIASGQFGVEPGLVGEIRHAAEHVDGLNKLLEVKPRWLGHRLHADVAVLVDDTLSAAEADRLGGQLKGALFGTFQRCRLRMCAFTGLILQALTPCRLHMWTGVTPARCHSR